MELPARWMSVAGMSWVTVKLLCIRLSVVEMHASRGRDSLFPTAGGKWTNQQQWL